MGVCKYCGKPAGFLKSKHAECEVKEQKRLASVHDALERLSDCVVLCVKSPEGQPKLDGLIEQYKSSGHFSADEIKNALILGWCRSVGVCLEDDVIDVSEEHTLVNFKKAFGLTEEELNADGSHSRVVKSAVLRDLLSGVLPQRLNLSEALPINLQKGEKVVWAYMMASYFEDKTKRNYVGGSRGVSVRVMKGVYYRVGAFKGTMVESTDRVLVDKGLLVLTDKHIYFAGPSKSLRIPYAKVVSFLPFEDGFGVIRDNQTAKPQIFNNSDGWFSYNLATNLAQFYNK